MDYKINKIVELKIDSEDEENLDEYGEFGVEVISLVEEPAIEVDFHYFNSDYDFESYSDYPESASNNAKRALKWVEENGWGSCGEATGKKRANQLANKEPISRETIARMASFKRHQQHKDVPYSEGCGGLMWDAWGGTSGIEWAINKLKKLDNEKLSECDSCDLENRLMLSEEAQDAIIEYANNNGEDINDNDLIFEFASLKDALKTGLVAGVVDALRKKLKGDPTKILKNEPKVYYRYTSASSSDPQRKFCKAMMRLSKSGRIFSEEQIKKMETINSQFAPKGQSSYSIFEYSGGVNCVHYWQKIKVFKNEQGQKVIITSGPETDAELNAAKSQNERKPSQWGSIANNARLNFSMDEEAKTVVGPVMIPDKFIIRKDEFGNPFYVYFTKETIKKLQEKFFKNNNHNKTDINHDGNIMGDNTLLESWIKEDEVHDKSLKYGFDEPIGTWFVSYKLSDESWQLVKEGKVNGFSLQGKFINELIESKDEKLLSKIKNILKNVEN